MGALHFNSVERGVVSALLRAGAQMLVVGGHAVVFHGYVRPLKDLDIFVLIRANLDCWRPIIEDLGGTLPDAEPIVAEYLAMGQRLHDAVCDTAVLVGDAVRSDARILLEGAQGTMLDVDHGTYPFVTSSNTVAGNAVVGCGLGPTVVDYVLVISKAYSTRVGGGPYPTELKDETGERLRKIGNEFGATTGRPRRTG